MESLAEARKKAKEAVAKAEREADKLIKMEWWFIRIIIALVMLVVALMGLWIKAIATNSVP